MFAAGGMNGIHSISAYTAAGVGYHDDPHSFALFYTIYGSLPIVVRPLAGWFFYPHVKARWRDGLLEVGIHGG
jgi:hypothetical protein